MGLPLWHVVGVVALADLVVVDLTEGAPLLARLDVVEADVELLAVGGVGVLGVGQCLPVAVQLGLAGALEAILEFICNTEE